MKGFEKELERIAEWLAAKGEVYRPIMLVKLAYPDNPAKVKEFVEKHYGIIARASNPFLGDTYLIYAIKENGEPVFGFVSTLGPVVACRRLPLSVPVIGPLADFFTYPKRWVVVAQKLPAPVEAELERVARNGWGAIAELAKDALEASVPA